MADFLSTGVSGLLAFQTALATTSHNISNVSTEGYTRQRTDLATRIPTPYGFGYVGNGVNVADVARVYDQFLTTSLRNQTSVQSRLDSYYNLASQVDNVLADPNAGLAPAMQQFFSAVQGVADNPSSVPARQVVLSSIDSLVQRFHTLNDRFSTLRDSVNSQISNAVSDINTLADSIATVNRNIVAALAVSGGKPPNDLLDQRDLLLKKLAEDVSVKTVEQDNGAVNVFIGNGQALVVGSDATHLQVTPNQYDQFAYEVGVVNGPNVTSIISGGKLGGALTFRTDVLQPAQNALGRIGVGLAQTFNAQNAQGLDLNGQLGGDVFGFGGVTSLAQAMPSSTNAAGGPTVTYSITDVTRLTTSDYRVSTTDGTNYTITRLSDNTVLGTTFTLDALNNIALPTEGLSLHFTAAASAGDSFLLSPLRSVAGDINRVISDPNGIAAALPFKASVASANLGNLSISQLDATSTVNLAVAVPAVQATGITLTFDAAANQFNVTGAVTGTLAYNPATEGSGKVFDLGTLDANYAGLTFNIAGTPLNGDVATVEFNNNATGDNANALKLAALDTTRILSGSSATFQEAYGQLVADVGTKTHQADIDLTAQQAVVKQAQQAVDSVSGVNLDEEAANIVKFQQAYQANAQVISVAKTLFDTLLNAVG